MAIRQISAFTFWSDKQPVQVEVDIVAEKDNKMLIRTWNGKYRSFIFSSKDNAWYPYKDYEYLPEEW